MYRNVIVEYGLWPVTYFVCGLRRGRAHLPTKLVELRKRHRSPEAVSPRARVVRLTWFGVADQFRSKGHEVRAYLYLGYLALPQGKNGRKMAGARVIRPLIVVTSEQISKGWVG